MTHPPRFCFVGERPSPTAAEHDWTWTSARLSARTINEALLDCGLVPTRQRWLNVWTTPGIGPPPRAEAAGLQAVHCAHAEGYILVALGRRVQRVLTKAGLPHLFLYHPAARSPYRRRAAYHDHVRSVLCPPAHDHTQGDRP